MDLQVVQGAAAFQALEPEWRRIHAEALDVSIFSGWDWLSLWWEHYGAGRELRVLVARVDGQVVGILPMYLEPSRLFRTLPIRQLRMIGVGGDTSPDYLGPIVLSEFRNAAYARFAQWLVESDEWQMAHLRDLLADPDFHTLVRAACRAGNKGSVVGVCSRIAVVPLAKSWEELLGAFNKDGRYRLTADLKRAEREGGVRFFRWEDLATLDRAIDKLIELHRRRWHGRATGYSFASQRYIEFHRTLIKRLAARGEAVLLCLEYKGEIVAIDYNYLFRGCMCAFQGGFDPRFSSIRPGKVLTAMSIRDAADRGLKEYDFLKGDYQNKRVWTDHTRETYYVRICGSDWRGRLAHLRHGVLPGIKQSAGQLMGVGKT